MVTKICVYDDWTIILTIEANNIGWSNNIVHSIFLRAVFVSSVLPLYSAMLVWGEGAAKKVLECTLHNKRQIENGWCFRITVHCLVPHCHYFYDEKLGISEKANIKNSTKMQVLRFESHMQIS